MLNGVYVSTKKETWGRSFPSIFLVMFCFIGFIFLSFFIKNVSNEAREDLIEGLQKERGIAEINNNLKIEYSAITQARFLELQAKRLGLKKATEEEVLVLR